MSSIHRKEELFDQLDSLAEVLTSSASREQDQESALLGQLLSLFFRAREDRELFARLERAVDLLSGPSGEDIMQQLNEILYGSK
jgi:hypothetical protein